MIDINWEILNYEVKKTRSNNGLKPGSVSFSINLRALLHLRFVEPENLPCKSHLYFAVPPSEKKIKN